MQVAIQAGDGKVMAGHLESCTLKPPFTRLKVTALRTFFQEKGFLFLAGFLDKDKVTQAGRTIRKVLHAEGFTQSVEDLRQRPVEKSPGMMDRQEWIQETPSLAQLLEDPLLYELMKHLFEVDEVSTIPFKWLRAVGSDLFTGLHNDHIYVGHLADRMITCWIPLCEISFEKGPMVIAPKSHSSPAWKKVQDLYQEKDLKSDGTSSGWLTRDPNTVLHLVEDNPLNPESPFFCTSNFSPGDVVVLDLKTIHMTAKNISDEYRISCDTRWFPTPD
jgi:hypothetical protein